MSERVNGVSGMARFREEWDEARKVEGKIDNATSEQGHINVEGSARCLSSVIYTPAAPQFLASIEAGVRPLVLALIQDLNCITYSSCEGHPPSDDGYPMRGRHVGILPRDAAEHAMFLERLRAAATLTPPVPGVVTVEVREDIVASDGVDLPCIDLLFVAGSYDWAAYAEKIDSVQAAFLDHLALR
jgi:uncharacterized protein